MTATATARMREPNGSPTRWATISVMHRREHGTRQQHHRQDVVPVCTRSERSRVPLPCGRPGWVLAGPLVSRCEQAGGDSGQHQTGDQDQPVNGAHAHRHR